MNLFWMNQYAVYMIPLIFWVFFWKGFALWTAVKLNQKKWFIALLLINTFGILEIFYLFYIAKKTWTDVKNIFKKHLFK